MPSEPAVASSDVLDAELGRWQQAIYEQICEACPGANIDGAGCDSGDPLDFTQSEIGQGLAHWIDNRDDLLRAAKNYFENSIPSAQHMAEWHALKEILEASNESS